MIVGRPSEADAAEDGDAQGRAGLLNGVEQAGGEEHGGEQADSKPGDEWCGQQ